MSWYFDQMLALLDADDLERYKATTGPRTLCVHPAESYNSSCILPNGEIRLYGHTIGRGKGQKDGGFGYLYSRDCGLSWHPRYAEPRSLGPAAYNPQSGVWVRFGNNDAPLDASICCTSKIGPDDQNPTVHHYTKEKLGCPKIPFLLRDKPMRWVNTCHRDIENADGSQDFSPVFLYSDDDGAHWTVVDLPTEDNHTWFAPDMGSRWRNRGSEPTVTELADGTLLLITRTSDDHPRAYRSHDHGESWTADGAFALHATNTTSVFHRLSSGKTLLLWNNTCPMPEHEHLHDFPMTHHGHVNGSFEDVFTNRDVCHAALSEDGEAWLGQREVLLAAPRNRCDYRRAGGRYNIGDQSLQQFEIWELPLNKVLVLCGQNMSTRRVMCFDLDWLLEHKRQDTFQSGLESVSTFQYLKSLCGAHFGHCAWNRTDGASMMSDPEQGIRDVVQLCRYHDPRLYNEKQGRVWNFPAAKRGTLSIEMRIDGSGVGVSLSDFWLNPSDPTMAQRHPFYFTLEKSDLEQGWKTVTLSYDTVAGEIAVSCKGEDEDRLLFYVRASRPCPQGLCYLHMQSLAQSEDARGTYVRLLSEESEQ